MELKPGYKQTAVGVIPEEWDAKAIGDEIDLLTGFPFPSSGYSKYGVRLLRGSNVKRGTTDWADDLTQYWPRITQDTKRYELNVGDIVIAMDGSLVGRSSARLKEEDLPALLLQRVARIRSSKIGLGYLNQFVAGDRFASHCDSVKTVTAIPHISPDDIRNFVIPVPPTTYEQDRIATALSDVDSLISSLDQLIAKKRDIKQATMQQLLTSKQRLPGFSGEWKKGRIVDLADVDPENLSGATDFEYRFNYISLEDVDRGSLTGYSEQVFGSAPSRARRVLRKGDILVSTVRPNLQSHLLIRREVKDYVCSTGFSVVRCKPHFADPIYIYYHFFSDVVNRQIEALLTGSNYPAINSADVRVLEIPWPPIEEQFAIASVLSDMDDEIAVLEQKRDKTRALKQGMMQELLTGRIRLV